VYAQVKKHYEPIISARYSGGDNLRILPLIVVANGCADRDPEVHRLLMDMVSPRQGTVVSSKEMVEAL